MLNAATVTSMMYATTTLGTRLVVEMESATSSAATATTVRREERRISLWSQWLMELGQDVARETTTNASCMPVKNTYRLRVVAVIANSCHIATYLVVLSLAAR